MESSVAPHLEVFAVDRWSVREMQLNPDKVKGLWEMLQRYPTLFSDLTRNDQANFVQALTAPHTMWFEVWEYDVIVGVIWFEELWQVTDCLAHLVFFDRQPFEKTAVCKEMIKWMFKNFPLRRISVTPPAIYHGTIRLLKRLGFQKEGVKREAVLIGGKWNDSVLFGITRSEVEAL